MVGRLDGVSRRLPSVDLLLYFLHPQGAVLSSQIEGTQTTFSEYLLFDVASAPNPEDVQEVSNYVAAMQPGLLRVREIRVNQRRKNHSDRQQQCGYLPESLPVMSLALIQGTTTSELLRPLGLSVPQATVGFGNRLLKGVAFADCISGYRVRLPQHLAQVDKVRLCARTLVSAFSFQRLTN